MAIDLNWNPADPNVARYFEGNKFAGEREIFSSWRFQFAHFSSLEVRFEEEPLGFLLMDRSLAMASLHDRILFPEVQTNSKSAPLVPIEVEWINEHLNKEQQQVLHGFTHPYL